MKIDVTRKKLFGTALDAGEVTGPEAYSFNVQCNKSASPKTDCLSYNKIVTQKNMI